VKADQNFSYLPARSISLFSDQKIQRFEFTIFGMPKVRGKLQLNGDC